MRNPLTRLLYIGVFGLGVSSAMIIENYLSKSNTLWEYIIGLVLLVFSVAFVVTSIILSHKRK